MEVDNAPNLYTSELISIINHCHRNSGDASNDDDSYDKSAEPDDSSQFSPEENEKIKTHVIIYNFLALSTVLEKSRDVGAVAIYEFPDLVKVFYAKNNLNDRCRAHVNQLAQIIRDLASDPQITPRRQFVYPYFGLMLSNAKSKLMSRFQKFKIAVQEPLAEHGIKTASDLAENLEYSALNSPAVAPSNRADSEAANKSPTNNVYDGLFIILSTLIKKVLATSDSVTYITDMSLNCYIFGHSALMINIANQHRQLLPLIEAAQKFGEYARGVLRLYRVITQTRETRKRYSRFEIHPIPSPQPITLSLHHDWFNVLRTVYQRRKGEEIPITPNQFRGKFGGIANYEKYSAPEFPQHAEVTLIIHLITVQRCAPTVIGISKACCTLCYEFITAMNRFNSTQGKDKWIVGGKHGNLWYWRCSLPENSPYENAFNAAIEAVRHWVENRIIEMIEECAFKPGSESPSHLSDEGAKEPELDEFWE